MAISKTLYVINPNSTRAVTQTMDEALNPLRRTARMPIQCVTLEAGPAGIQSQRDVDAAAVLVRLFAEQHWKDAAGFITACFSDPGLHALREIPGVMSFGISECAMSTALAIGQRIGVIAMLEASIPRHWRKWGEMGITARIAGEVAISRSIAQMADADSTREAMIAAGQRLADEYGANVLVMGCAGMATFRDSVQQATGLPVIEPTQVAVSMALGQLESGW
jgi:Asp/Glu/hydantoin racemase